MQPCTYRIGQDTSPNDGGVREIDLTDPNARLPGHGDESSQGEVIKEKGDSVELFVRRGATVNGPSSTVSMISILVNTIKHKLINLQFVLLSIPSIYIQ